jgi:hypothetical protein
MKVKRNTATKGDQIPFILENDSLIVICAVKKCCQKSRRLLTAGRGQLGIQLRVAPGSQRWSALAHPSTRQGGFAEEDAGPVKLLRSSVKKSLSVSQH